MPTEAIRSFISNLLTEAIHTAISDLPSEVIVRTVISNLPTEAIHTVKQDLPTSNIVYIPYIKFSNKGYTFFNNQLAY
jgi:hypothetical protein